MSYSPFQYHYKILNIVAIFDHEKLKMNFMGPNGLKCHQKFEQNP